MSSSKTNAMRILDSSYIEYKMMSYSPKNEKIDGILDYLLVSNRNLQHEVNR